MLLTQFLAIVTLGTISVADERADFIRNGWRTRRLHKLVVTSKAHQRASDLGHSEQLSRERSRKA
ncbi:MAG: hypothetical protein CMJ48_03865 [Planctomycetaceae bacterium]|nr:hypothetical protein [Planctomycetaceae bacterium]